MALLSHPIMRNLLNLALALLLLPIGTSAAAQPLNFDPPVFLHSDLNGSVVMASDAAGQVIWLDRHEPFGQKALAGAPLDADTSYHGKARDAQTGLIYFGARYYNPLLGRFLSVDPVGVQSDNLHSFNRYAFANNNPYKYTDPDGNNPVLVFEGAKLGGTGGFFVCGPLCAGIGAVGGGFTALYLGDKALTWIFSEQKKGGDTENPSNTKPPLSDYKDALDKVHDEVGKLPKGESGKFGSPQAGDSKKGYRLDPPHDGAAQGGAESKHHFNWWDYTGGKRGSGGRSGAIPISD